MMSRTNCKLLVARISLTRVSKERSGVARFPVEEEKEQCRQQHQHDDGSNDDDEDRIC